MAYDGTLKFDTKIDTEGFQKGIDGITDIAQKGIKATMAILSGAAAAVGAIGTAAIKVGSSFEAGMSKVQAVSGASGDDLERLKDKAMEMGAATKFSATESAEAMNYMAMAGWKTEQMLDGIEGIMNLAAAAGEDLAITSDIVTDALTAFGMKAEQSGHFADVLAAASSNANTNVSMLGESFKYAAPVAGALGYSAEDTAIALGLMANAGIKASQGGTVLRATLSRMSKPTEEVAIAMEYLGLSLQNDEGEMNSLMDIMADMREAFGQCKIPLDEFQEKLAELDGQYASGELTEEKYNKALEDLVEKAYGAEGALKAKYAAAIAGTEGMSGLLAIVNAAPEDFDKLTEAIYNCDGAAEEMAAIMQDNLQGDLVILQSGLEGLGVSIYGNLQEPLRGAAKEAQAMVQELKVAFDEGGLDGLVGAFGGVLAQIAQRIAQEAPALVDAAVELVSSFCGSLREAEGLGEIGAGLVASIVSGVMSSAGEMWSTAVVLFAGFLSGMAEQLPQMLETGKEAIAQFGQAVLDNAPSILSSAKAIASTLLEGIMSGLPEITKAGVDMMGRLAGGISSGLPELIPVAMDALVGFSGSLRENAGLLVDAGLDLLMSLAQSLIDNIPVFIETVPAIVTNIAGIINDNAPKLLATGIELIGKLAMGLLQAIPTLVSNIPQIIEAVVSVFTAFNWISIGKNIIKFIADGVKSLARSLPDALRNIGKTAVDWLRAIDWKTLGADIIDLIVIGVKSLVTAIPELIKSIGHTAVEWFKSIDWLDLGISLVKGIIGGITGALDGLWDAVGSLCSGVLDGIKGFFGIHSPSTVMAEQGGFLVQGMINGLEPLPDEAGVILAEALDGVARWGGDMVGGAVSAAQGFVTSIVDGVGELPDMMTDIGSNIVSGIGSGISSGWGWLQDTVSGLAGNLFASAKKALGINSPSRVFADEVGQWIPPGIGMGMEKAMPDLEERMGSEMEQLAGKMQAAVEMETGNITVRSAARAQHEASKEYPAGGDTYVEEKFEQHNTYNTPVATPSEVARTQREAARKLLGGVK